MRIQTRLKLGAMASMAVAVIIFVAIVLTAQRINTDLKRGNLYSELVNRVYTLQLHINDFLLHPERHEQNRWHAAHGSIEDLLDELEMWYRTDGVTLDAIRANHRELSTLLLQLEATSGVSSDLIMPNDLRMATAGRLMVKLDSMAREASRLKELNEAGTVKSQRNFAFLLVFLLLLLVITTGAILYVASNHITRSLAELDLGTRIVADGNFDYRIKIDAEDELGELARAFNRMAGQLKKSYSDLRGEISERRNAEEALRLDEARLEALFQMSQLTGASRQQIAEFTLEQGVRLTRSRIGFLGFMNEDESVLTLQTWADSVMGMCSMKNAPVRFQVATAGLWAEAARQRKPIVVNDYRTTELPSKGLPEGHIPLDKVMVTPVFDGSRIAALAAVGNKDEDYNAADLRQFTLHMDGMWKIIQHEQAEKALRQGESLAAMGRALSCVAHDIKTPLIAIGGFSRLVREHLKDTNPEDCAKLDVVIREVRRLENLVRDMLDFARPLELNLAPEDISGIVRESIEVVERSAHDRGIQVLYYPSENILPVSLDPMRIKQVVINLILNAVQASPEGETVFVRSCLSGSYVLLEIIDRGCGIPPENRESIFTPFFTTKREGTGLGLPIVKKIVETHQGTVQILDNPDRGVTIRVALPIA